MNLCVDVLLCRLQCGWCQGLDETDIGSSFRIARIGPVRVLCSCILVSDCCIRLQNPLGGLPAEGGLVVSESGVFSVTAQVARVVWW